MDQVSSRGSLHRTAIRNSTEVRYQIGVSWLPALKQTDHFLRDRKLKMMIDTGLTRRGAEPIQANLANPDRPIKALFWRSNVPAKMLLRFGVLARARVTDARYTTHERCELLNLNPWVTKPFHQIDEILPRLASHPRHPEDKNAPTHLNRLRTSKTRIRQSPSSLPV